MTTRRRSHPHVVWVTLESVRRRNTSLHGYERETTPELERLASTQRSLTHDLCVAQSLWTPAAVGSMLTGVYPYTHGLGMAGTGENRLPESLTTLPEELRSRGYRTVGVSANAYVSKATGLDRGFDEFTWLSKQAVGRHGVSESASRLDRLRWAVRRFRSDDRKLDHQTVTHAAVYTALSKFDTASDPTFAYLHLGNPHYPYLPPEQWLRELGLTFEGGFGSAYDSVLSTYRNRDELVSRIEHDFPDESELAVFQSLYDAEITLADHYVGKLYDRLVATSDRDVIMVVTGDHGELFGEYGLLGHNLTLADETTRVPLLLVGIEAASSDIEVVQHVDLTATVLAACGSVPEQFVGTPLQRGGSSVGVSQRGYPNYGQHTDVTVDIPDDLMEPFSAIRTPVGRVRCDAGSTRLRAPTHTTAPTSRDPDVSVDDLPDAVTRTPRLNGRATAFSESQRTQLKRLGYL